MGNQRAIREELRKLGDSTNRPGAKVMREILDDIQMSIEKGVPRKVIYEKLVENGVRLTFESFVVTLKRLRKEEKKGKQPTVKVAQAPPTTSTISNPLKALSSQKKDGEFNAIPQVQFEVDDESLTRKETK